MATAPHGSARYAVGRPSANPAHPQRGDPCGARVVLNVDILSDSISAMLDFHADRRSRANALPHARAVPVSTVVELERRAQPELLEQPPPGQGDGGHRQRGVTCSTARSSPRSTAGGAIGASFPGLPPLQCRSSLGRGHYWLAISARQVPQGHSTCWPPRDSPRAPAGAAPDGRASAGRPLAPARCHRPVRDRCGHRVESGARVAERGLGGNCVVGSRARGRHPLGRRGGGHGRVLRLHRGAGARIGGQRELGSPRSWVSTRSLPQRPHVAPAPPAAPDGPRKGVYS